MTGSIKTKTPKYKFIIPQFNIATWHDYIEDNFRAIDALFYNIFDIQNFSGSWTKTTKYKKDQVLFISEDYEVDENGQLKKDDQGELIVSEFSGRLVKVLKDHTTDNSDYFSLYYFNHKDEYELFADASTSQKFANLAKQYSENAQQSEDNAELYKNNAQGYAQEAENSKNIAQQNAQLATNKAESAVSSATVAKNSENSAANSATLAEGYKNSAKSFADSAKSSKDITEENVQTVTSLVQDPNLVAVGTDLRSSSSNIKNVSSISEQTKNVSDNMSYIKSVDNNKVNINKAVTNEANITTVAKNINNVNITAQNKDNINTVVSYKDAIITTSTNINAVNNVSDNMLDVKKAVQSANDAKLWAIGTKTEKPEGSSKYWAEQAKNVVQTPDASETVKGIVRLATSDEVTTGTNNSAAITPLKLKPKLDSKQDISTAVNYDNISNCITEIPQNIKLELNNGTLTLKAGSKVYIPNGFERDGVTKKFDVVNIQSDITVDPPYTNEPIFIYYYNNGTWQAANNAQCSGTSNTVSYGYWYDTTNNFIKRINAGEAVYPGVSFPLAIINASNGSWVSIDQVFNGFGYIGSTVFALPGVKGLIPNGRNADGSLKSIDSITTKVNLLTFSTDTDGTTEIVTANDWIGESIGHYSYNSESNFVLFDSDKITGYMINSCKVSKGRITSFTPKTVFHALDYNIVSIIDTELAKKLNVNATTIGEITDLRTPILNEGNTSNVYIDGYMINSEDDINGCLVAPVLFANGNVGNRLMVRKKINGKNVYRGLTIGIKADGSIFTDLEKSNNKNSIVTTISLSGGYVRFGNGLQICWGNSPNNQTITLPQAFKNNTFRVAFCQTENSSHTYNNTIVDKTTTSFKFINGYTGDWIAIGWWY